MPLDRVTLARVPSQPVTVLCGDCREVIPTLPDGLVKLVLSDPPYGMDYRTNRTATKGPAIVGDGTIEDAARLIDSILPDIQIVLDNDAWLYWFCGERLRSHLIQLHRQLREFSPDYDELIWAKPIGSGDTTGQRYRPSYERVLVFRKGEPRLSGHPGNLIWGDRPGKLSKIHSMQKELSGLAEMIEQATGPGDVILDPFAGSGSTAAAMCVLLPQSEWRKVILIEQDPEMCEQIVRRLSPYTEVAREI